MHKPGIGAVGLVAPRPDSEESVKDFIERHLGSAVSIPMYIDFLFVCASFVCMSAYIGLYSRPEHWTSQGRGLGLDLNMPLDSHISS